MSQLAMEIEDPPSETVHRFGPIVYQGVEWDLSHLDSFAFKIDPGLGTVITVVVLFSCHCFSHSFRWDTRSRSEIPCHEIYDDGREQRVLNPKRYQLSRQLLRNIVKNLPARRITVADRKQPNFVTLEKVNSDGTVSQYAVFFEVDKDKNRKRRLMLRIQSAYVLDTGLTKRQEDARKVGFDTLLRATYQGKQIRG
jgi:hypothetical protein